MCNRYICDIFSSWNVKRKELEDHNNFVIANNRNKHNGNKNLLKLKDLTNKKSPTSGHESG